MLLFIACILLYQFGWAWYWYVVACAIYGIQGYADDKFHVLLRNGRFDTPAPTGSSARMPY